jgi:hypothetical protein
MDIHDAPFIDIARSDEVFAYEVAKPLSGVRIDLVVVSRHAATLS